MSLYCCLLGSPAAGHWSQESEPGFKPGMSSSICSSSQTPALCPRHQHSTSIALRELTPGHRVTCPALARSPPLPPVTLSIAGSGSVCCPVRSRKPCEPTRHSAEGCLSPHSLPAFLPDSRHWCSPRCPGRCFAECPSVWFGPVLSL